MDRGNCDRRPELESNSALCGLLGLQLRKGFDDRIEIADEAIALRLVRQHRQHAIINPPGERLRRAQHPPTFLGQFDSIRTRVFLGSATLQQALLEHAAHDICERRPIDSGPLDEMGLRQTFILRDSDEHCELTRRQITHTHLGLKDVPGTLACAVQQVNRGLLEFCT